MVFFQEFNVEVEKMKEILEKLEKENERLKDENNRLVRERKGFEEMYNEIAETNYSSIQANANTEKILNDHDQNQTRQTRESDLPHAKQAELQLSMLREELEHSNIEKSKLKEALNEAINKCAAYVMKEKEFKNKIKEKETQISNLQGSKALLQQTFTDQVFALKS